MKKLYKWIRKKIFHYLRINTGKIISWRDKDRVAIGFKCDCCGEIDGEVIIYKLTDEELELTKE